jgi:hypothetical protein
MDVKCLSASSYRYYSGEADEFLPTGAPQLRPGRHRLPNVAACPSA